MIYSGSGNIPMISNTPPDLLGFGFGCGCGKDQGDLKSPPEIKDPMIFPAPEQIRGYFRSP
jgi:hypothetical protein